MTTVPSEAILDRLGALHPKVIDLGLDRIARLLAALGHPERRLPPIVHIAGTNGKGSTLAMIRAGLEASGARVHAYTSPHLVAFRERIRVAGRLIAETALADCLTRVEAANGGRPITVFEITTAAAFLAFAERPAEWCLLEVGLGGRLDATNAIPPPRLTVITPIALDHQQFLGDNVVDIAAEKAGILKPGVPCIVGPQLPAAMDAIRARAEAIGAPLLIHGQDWDAWVEHGRLAFQDLSGLLDLPLPLLPGRHQIANAGAALAALRLLGQGEAAARAALTGPVWPARMQRLGVGPLAAGLGELWLDGGHNPAAGAALAEALAAMRPKRPLILVAGMLGTKDAAGFLAPFRGVAARVVTVPVPGSEAGIAPAALAGIAAAVGLAADAAPDVPAALERIRRSAPEARVMICGSLYLAGAVLALNGTPPD